MQKKSIRYRFLLRIRGVPAEVSIVRAESAVPAADRNAADVQFCKSKSFL